MLVIGYLQVNTLSEWIIAIYWHKFTNKEWEISILHEAASCGTEYFELIVSEWVQGNPDNSRAMSVLTFLLFKLNTLQTQIVKVWVSRSHDVVTVVYWGAGIAGESTRLPPLWPGFDSQIFIIIIIIIKKSFIFGICK